MYEFAEVPAGLGAVAVQQWETLKRQFDQLVAQRNQQLSNINTLIRAAYNSGNSAQVTAQTNRFRTVAKGFDDRLRALNVRLTALTHPQVIPPAPALFSASWEMMKRRFDSILAERNARLKALNDQLKKAYDAKNSAQVAQLISTFTATAKRYADTLNALNSQLAAVGHAQVITAAPVIYTPAGVVPPKPDTGGGGGFTIGGVQISGWMIAIAAVGAFLIFGDDKPRRR